MKRSALLISASLLVVAQVRGDVGGLSAEADVRSDGILVRRVRDPRNGVVCYVASAYAYVVAPHGNTLAITCLKETP